MTRAIFLDIDGVLNCSKTPNPRKFPYIVDTVLLQRFRELVGATKAKVVMSSTWRCDPVGLLAAKHFDIPFDEVCPDIPGKSRREEMISWLGDHPEITRFAVLDDEDDDLDKLPLFQPDPKEGLSPEIAQGIEDFLAGRTDKDMRANKLKRLGQNLHGLFTRAKG